MGRTRSMEPADGLTLFAMANELWNTSAFTSSSEKVGGSPAAVVQVMCAGPPEVRLVGVSIVSAVTKGMRKARVLSLKNIVASRKKEESGVGGGARREGGEREWLKEMNLQRLGRTFQ